MQHLFGSIAANRDRGAAVPADLAEAYEAALQRGVEVCFQTLLHGEGDARHVLLGCADLAACLGDRRLARVLWAMEMEVEVEEFDVRCPGCSRLLTLGFGARGISVGPVAWMERPAGPVPGRPAPSLADLRAASPHDPGPFARIAASLGRPGLARGLADFAGRIECPGCAAAFSILAGHEPDRLTADPGVDPGAGALIAGGSGPAGLMASRRSQPTGSPGRLEPRRADDKFESRSGSGLSVEHK